MVVVLVLVRVLVLVLVRIVVVVVVVVVVVAAAAANEPKNLRAETTTKKTTRQLLSLAVQAGAQSSASAV